MTNGRDGHVPPGADDDLEALEFEPLDPDAEAAAAELAAMPVDGSLDSVIADLAAADPGVGVLAVGDGFEYRLGDRAFARIAGNVASFRLRPEIVAAALRTDDTAPSPLGREWVAFGPRRFDRFALDRATSWFALARRHAGDGPPPRTR